VIEIRGMHQGSIKLSKKGITLRGEDPQNDGIIGTDGSVITSDGKYGAENLTIENLKITNGKGGEAPGGGISWKGVKGENTLSNLIITRNTTDKVGGGVMITAGKVTVENCWIHENYAKAFGGGLALNSGNISDSDIIIRNSVISSNTSGDHGAGIYLNGNKQWGDESYINVLMENTIITYNSTGKKGGAIFCKSANHLKDNTANTSMKMNHVTVAYNRSTDEEGRLPGIAFYGEEGSEPRVSIMNSLIVLNGEMSEPDISFAKSNVLVNTANIYGKLAGLKVVDVDMSTSIIINKAPMIGLSDKLTKAKDEAMAVLKLQANSSAIDTADASTALKVDINGKAREVADIGAVEFN
jgi:predicted outer membrane repeat protein